MVVGNRAMLLGVTFYCILYLNTGTVFHIASILLL
jgi:hypothetical protein